MALCEAIRTASTSSPTLTPTAVPSLSLSPTVAKDHTYYYVLNMQNVIPLYLNVQNNVVTGLFASPSDFQNQINNVILPPGTYHHNDNIFDYAAGHEKLYGITLFGILGVQYAPRGLLGLIRAGVTSPLILESASSTGAFPSYFQQIFDVKVTPLLAPLSTFAPTKALTHKPTVKPTASPTRKHTAAPTHKHAAVPTCKHTATPTHKPTRNAVPSSPTKPTKTPSLRKLALNEEQQLQAQEEESKVARSASSSSAGWSTVSGHMV